MNRMDAEEVLFISFFEEGTRSREYKKDLISSFDETRSFHFLFHFHFFSTHEEKDKENYLWEDRREVRGHSVTLH